MARIGVYGGTFNPIHNTHIGIAQAALTQYKLDKVYFLVAGTPPHKNTADGISDINRLDMVRIAIKDIPLLDIDDREIYRAGKSYSYITFSEYHNERPDDEIFFIMGSDSLINFKNWVKPDIISEYVTEPASSRSWSLSRVRLSWVCSCTRPCPPTETAARYSCPPTSIFCSRRP